MLKNAIFKKTICATTIFSFAMTGIVRTANAYGYRLTPESFEKMYSLAQNGRVESLRASINRGLNIDAMNENGDTGLCVAARRHDIYTYNAFRAAGANPRHPCTQNISNYNSFVTSSRAVPVTSTPRAAYGYIGKEKYSVSPKIWWWLGGAALVGGGVALALSGGGGGGGSSNNNPDSGDKEKYNSLGATAGTGTDAIVKLTANAVNNENSSYIEMENSKTSKIEAININSNVLSNTEYLDIALKAQNDGIYTNNTNTTLKIGDGTIGMSALNNSYINNFGYINIDSYNASIGMVASEGSYAINYGKGIISEDNEGSSNNGISLNFSGYNDSDTLIAMYADTKSSLQNYGDIKGTAIKSKQTTQDETYQDNDTGLVDPDLDNNTTVKTSASKGTLIGMEAMIINTGKDLNKDTINLLNAQSGKINLSAGDAGISDNEISTSLIGMGSFLDYNFMNGSQTITLAENINMQNYGDITIGYTGNYVPSSENSLRKATGGLIGIRADANTSATNRGTINLNLEEYSEESSNIDTSAGMQSVHGGNIYNYGDININTSAGNQRKNYGMISVEGSGTVSGLYTNLKQNIINHESGKISVEASNSFGIASFNGGNLKNEGNITLGKNQTTTLYQKNIAMYAYGKSKEATMENTGTIDIYSHDSIAMQNDFAGGTSIYNNGIINIHESATNSYVFGGAYSEAHNSGTINYEANSSGDASSDGQKYDPFINHHLSVGNSIISTQSRSVLDDDSTDTTSTSTTTSSSTTEKIYNDEGAVINVKGSSYISALSVEASDDNETTQGKAFNNGTINILDYDYGNATNTIGMYLGSGSLNNAYIINNGTISTESRFSSAMASESTKNASMINNGYITANKEYSLGMFSSGITNIQNNKNIIMNADNSVAIYNSGSEGKSSILNSENGYIQVGQESAKTENSYGIYIAENAQASIENNGAIRAYTKEAGAGIYSKGSNVSIKNNNVISAYADDAYAIFASGTADITNNQDGIINVGSSENTTTNSYAIYNEAEGTISNKGTINLYNNGETEGYAVYSTGNSEITNDGTINLNGENSTAIFASNGKVTNKSTIDINHDKNIGLKSSNGVTTNNSTTGIINVGSATQSVSNSDGMLYIASDDDSETTESSGNLENNGTINLYSSDNGTSHAVNIKGNASFTNNGYINSYNDYSSAIYLSEPTISDYSLSKINVTNSGNIVVDGDNSYALNNSILPPENEEETIEISLKNTGDITLNGNNGIAVYGNGLLTVTNSGNINVTDGTAIKNVTKVTNTGNINVTSGTAIKNASTIINSGEISGTTYAIDGGSELTNNVDAVISISSGTAAINGVSSVINKGTIEVTGTAVAAIYGATDVDNSGTIKIHDGHGIYTTNPGTITNSGSITVESGSGNGIYVVVPSVESVVTITNTGTINVADGHAIYIEKNYDLNTEAVSEGDKNGTKYIDNTTVEPGAMGESAVAYGGSCGEHCKNGEIVWSSTVSTTSSSLIAVSDTSLLNNVRLLNLGQINLTGDVDFGSTEDNTSVAAIGRNGSFEADSFSGTVLADTSLVEGGFNTVYVNEDAFIGENNGLSITSQSYLFDASLVSNSNGNLNVVMTMSSFDDKIENSRISQYLSQNYQNQKGEKVFDVLKTASTKNQFDDYLNKELGFNIVPNFTQQGLDIEKTVNKELNDDLLVATNETKRSKVNVLSYKNQIDSKDELSGYNDKVVSVYGYTDKSIENNLRLGFAITAARSDSNFDDDASRYNNMLEISSPIIFSNNKFRTMFKPKLGFARGHYRRSAVNQSYKANTNELYYGFDLSLRNTINLDYAMFEPNTGFDFTGLYHDNIHENNDGLKIKDNNTISAPIYLGLDIKKNFEFGSNNYLSLTAGGRYYHETGTKVNDKVSISDMIGFYDMKDKRFQRNYGLLSLKGSYTYHDLVISASANTQLKHKYNPYYMFSLGYNF